MADGSARVTVPTLHCRDFDLHAVREALTATLEAGTYNGTALRVNAWLADQWSPPCALIGTFTVEFADGDYDQLTTAHVSVRLVVPVPALRPAQLELDAILGAFVAAITADRTLGETVLGAIPLRATPVVTAKGNADLPSYEVELVIVL